MSASAKKIIILSVLVLVLALPIFFFPPTTTTSLPTQTNHFVKFKSAEDFQTYLTQAQALTEAQPSTLTPPRATLNTQDTFGALEKQAPDRSSTTNVQVLGIDEPDLLKYDATTLYYSQPSFRTPSFADFTRSISSVVPFPEKTSLPPQPTTPKLQIISAFPPVNLKALSQIDIDGSLLLNKTTLIVFNSQKLVGYDVANPASPSVAWTYDLTDTNQVSQARLYDNQLYVVMARAVTTASPCPYVPLTSVSIACDQIYHPSLPSPVDTTYTVLVLNPQTGDVQNKLSFVGSSANSVIYMSPQALYLTHTLPGDQLTFILNFFTQAQDLISPQALARLHKLAGYDLSNQAKMTELQAILADHHQALSPDESVRFANELTNQLTDYLKVNRRNLEKTAIVKISLADFAISAQAEVPGHPLNQFSLDDYQNTLRLATTVSDSVLGVQSSVNDVYVLDARLNRLGAVQDLGLTEQIYAVRFVANQAYVVTFRQTDPFYVLDLSNPAKPHKTGELKIPGFSAYLHPLTDSLILGIGREDSQVKVSLFDVSNPASPTELAKYHLQDYNSDILQTHHAFLHDPKHQVFFVPGTQDGYLFSYADNTLSLVKAVADIRPKRALYLNDYLYLVGETEIRVYAETDWAELNRLAL